MSAELKAQGNALFVAKNFKEAAEKYTAAIQAGDEAADPKGLAVLYANRAACRSSLKRYADSRDDARKATELDPTYAKAWARLASAKDAMCNYIESQESWQRALDALPKSDLKPAEHAQKAQYQAGLESAMTAVTRMYSPPAASGQVQSQGRMPWELAAAKLPSLRVLRPPNYSSSAWVIHSAYEEFMSGVRRMKQLQIDPVTGQMRGMPRGIVDLTNGAMRDARVMDCIDDKFLSEYNNQVRYEANAFRPWPEAGPEVVVREALARQRSEGWDAARVSVSWTVRAWIMRAVMEGSLYARHGVALEFYKRAAEVIRRLREEWLLVPKNDRGVIFEQSFMFGLQQLYIDSIMQTYSSDPSPELLEELIKEADLLVREVDEAFHHLGSQGTMDPGFLSSFYIYPRAAAFANKGFYYNKKATLSPNESQQFFRKAAVEYLNAVNCYPQDDEQHPWFLNIALTNMLASHLFPLRETLDVMKRIRETAPKAKEIWENSLSAPGLWDTLAGVGEQEDTLRGMLEQGKVTLDSCIGVTAEE
ncbi:hypothetical protein DFH07DRAFT_819311 [Mycena maculata]|uniref:TPR-like protein n=1 Tax=Mycena maculata TaxID=230809 RepID=A0AAD7NER8_9AGAR|nr:hypothetical protein DFH07DRAFT_819311 [Mycena maculata]